MKRLLSFFLTLILITAIAGANPNIAHADSASVHLYVKTNKVPTRHLNYAKKSINDIIPELRNIGIDYTKYDLSKPITFGSAFKLDDITYIPVLVNNSIIALTTISEYSGQLSWSISIDFAQKLNALRTKTSPKKPVTLKASNGNVFATIAGKTTKLTNNPTLKQVSTFSSASTSTSVVDVLLSTTNSGMKLQNILYEYRAYTWQYRYLNLNITETQGQQNWCAAFATATILRYRGKGSVKAKDIMRFFYPSTSNLNSKSLSHKQVIQYANKKGSWPVKKASTLTITQVRAQIDKNKPIYLSTAGAGRYKGSNHAMVLRGYSLNAYSVWNPWNKGYVSMSINSKTVSVSGGSFTWRETIYGW